MGGLDNILKSIAQDAENDAEKIILKAREEAAEINMQAKDEQRTISEENVAKIQEECMRISSSVEAQAEAEAAETVLIAKNKVINQVLDKVKAYIKTCPTAEYEDLLLKIFNANKESGKGEMLLSESDKNRLSEDFGEKIRQADSDIVISDEAAKIDGGFIIRYGKIDINCSIDSLFEDKQNAFADIINKRI